MVEISLEELTSLITKSDNTLLKKKINNKNRYNISIKGNIDVAKKIGGDRIIAGYANVAVVDKQEQLIPIETLQKGIETLLNDPHYANLMLVHQNIQVGKILERYGKYETKVDDKGLFIVCELRRDTEVANEVWNDILDGKYGAFSIGCEVITRHKECDDNKCIMILDEINIFEVSICSSPVNQESGFVIVSKSEYESHLDNNVCIECDIKSDSEKMVEETKKEDIEDKTEETEEKIEEESPKEEEKSETDVLSQILERMESMERKMNAFEGLLNQANKEEEEEECKSEESEKPEEKAKEEEIPEDEEPEEEEMSKDTEEKGAPWGSMDDKNQKPVATPEIMDPTKYPNLSKPIEDLTKAVQDLNKKLSKDKTDDVEELKLAIKARDDQIEALKKKVEISTKSEEEEEPEKELKKEKDEGNPQAVKVKSDKPQIKTYASSPIKIRNGEVFFEDDM